MKHQKIKKEFEANLLDGDKIEDCRGTMLSARVVWDWFSSTLDAELEGERQETLDILLQSLKQKKEK